MGEIRFGDGGPGRNFDCTLICPDCKVKLHFRGTHWTNDDENVAAMINFHRSEDCKALKNVVWRATHRHGPIAWWDRRMMRRKLRAWRNSPPS